MEERKRNEELFDEKNSLVHLVNEIKSNLGEVGEIPSSATAYQQQRDTSSPDS